MKIKTTINVDEEFRKRLEEVGQDLGVGWTIALQILAREGLAAREKTKPGA